MATTDIDTQALHETDAPTFDAEQYPFLSEYATLMTKPSRPVIGREHEIRRLLASLNRAELSNAFLLGDAGAGKTMLVQGASMVDTGRIYVEVDLSKMAASNNGEDGAVQMASRIKGLFDDALRYKQNSFEALRENGFEHLESAPELVMFIDEFHLLIQLSPAAAQAIKPVLAESGRRGVKIIAATTYAEFHQYVEQDQALMQRLQRINVREPDKEVVLSILESISKAHGVRDEIYDPTLFELIYEYSNRYIPADSQPRKSILLLDSMIGWYRTFPETHRLDRQLLGEVIYDSAGIKVAFEIDGRQIEHALNERVFSQEFAMKVIEERLQIAVANLHDKTRPISSFLFTGATGTGKTETVKALAALLFGSERSMIRFDMSEYALDTSLERFREELTSRVWNNSHAVILFDEVEKANPAITRLMLQVLDDGRLSNAQGREVGFLNTYIVLTTNAGSELYNTISHYGDDTATDGLAKYQKVIRKSLIENDSFAPEIINRMNVVVPFKPLDAQTYSRIAHARIVKFCGEVQRTHAIDVRVHKDVVPFLVHESFDLDTDSGGARGLVSRIDEHVIAPVSRYINNHKHNLSSIGVFVHGEMAISNKAMRTSNARIEVGTLDSRRLRQRA